MKQHLNTLFVTTQGTYLRKDGKAVDVRIEKKTRLRVPLHNLDGIVGFGRVSMSPALMAACAEAWPAGPRHGVGADGGSAAMTETLA